MEIDRKKIIILRCLLAVGYILLLAPFVYSVFYSMPANDDFALGINWWGGNIITEGFRRLAWNYMHWFGQSGVIAILIQVILNPLFWFQNSGHSFGICMVIVFLAIAFGTIYAARRLIALIVKNDNKIVLDVFAFLTALLLFTSYYYNDVYNWWSGVPGYSLMMMLNIFTFGNIVKYTNTHKKNDYIWMIVFGVITCTSLMNCVATGLFYLIFIFGLRFKDGDSLVKKLCPLALYVISGIITVIAPGNYERIEYERYFGYEVADPQYIHSAIITAERVVYRFVMTMVNKPWTISIVIAIALLGMFIGGEEKTNLKYLIISAVCVFIAAFGAVYPYVLGSNKTFDSEFANRIYFVEDYIVFIGMAIIAFRLGQWISIYIDKKIDIKQFVVSYVLLLVLTCGFAKLNPYTTAFVPTDIVNRVSIIKETYYFWDGILEEAENSSEKDVVITRKDVDWCPYVYGCGLSDNSLKWPEGENEYYCGSNEAVAKMFGKDNVTLILE